MTFFVAEYSFHCVRCCIENYDITSCYSIPWSAEYGNFVRAERFNNGTITRKPSLWANINDLPLKIVKPSVLSFNRLMILVLFWKACKDVHPVEKWTTRWRDSAKVQKLFIMPVIFVYRKWRNLLSPCKSFSRIISTYKVNVTLFNFTEATTFQSHISIHSKDTLQLCCFFFTFRL